MKTLSKKLLTLLLAFVMLVSVVPFQAMASQVEAPAHNMKVKFVDEAGNVLAAPVAYNEYANESCALTSADAQLWLNDTNVDQTKWEMPDFGTMYPEQNANGIWVYEVTLTAKAPATDPTTEPPTTEAPTTEAPTTTAPAEDETTTITFIDTLNEVEYEREFEDGKLDRNAPSPVYEGYKFLGWFTGKNGTGNELDAELKATNGPATTFYSHWKKSTDDKVSNLTVYAKLYAGGTLKKTVELLQVTLEDGTNAFKWLSNNESTIADKIASNSNIASNYIWGDHYYYDYSGKELLSQQDLEMKGDKSVVVKLYSKDEATVLVYVHRKTTSAAERILEMGGYVKGDVVSYDSVKSVVKKHYTGSNMELKGLYTTSAWNQLKNGEKPTAANGITVEDNGTLKIHVLLTNATASNNADPSNPKTGDSIFMAVTVMAVSATALAAAYLLNKKRMVK